MNWVSVDACAGGKMMRAEGALAVRTVGSVAMEASGEHISELSSLTCQSECADLLRGLLDLCRIFK